MPRTTLVTGATRGIGRGVVATLAARGDRMVLTGRDPIMVEQAADAIPGEVVGIVLDVADEGSVGRAAAEVAATVDCLDARQQRCHPLRHMAAGVHG